ncbi:methyltransferase domain-containing protein [Paracnuella aquatica]|uniref:methyltransferase domain-containing protein n=1 Tax=Paracnuella aquatica TaxID=2268757 RepID=UPI000DEFC3EB|nr:methyltransferase domain-containing protein [Paracnuella aquatica]RPD51958.1 methyltransferase domain-containing protein [Paracnuella aquatica]
MFVKAYLEAAETIIGLYEGKEPLANFLKKYFAAHKKYGSRDRKQIGQLVYSYYRVGRSLQSNGMQTQLLAALFLCANGSQPVLQQIKSEWNDAVQQPLAEKMELLQNEIAFDAASIFPFASWLSAEIQLPDFARSFLIQPDTFLRLRPGKEGKVQQQLDEAGINYKLWDNNTVSVPPGLPLDDLLMMDRDLVVQDKSSQQVLSLLEPVRNELPKNFSAWDCCAASGGKSILLHDLFPGARIMVSDIREAILANLRKRFERAGIAKYQWFVGDVSDPHFHHKPLYDLVLCDAPCSGSGTWARTPEWLHFFTEQKLQHYVQLQQKIAGRASRNVREGGYFLYITCSVFQQENEEMVALLQKDYGLQLLRQQYFTGYKEKADTLFAALFRR